ncbi:MAG: hypothetical protein KBC21_02460 [Candidatus Pacebacteria bacterium]|jgi:hypothetical protein|nr:hypothetical protein [Candidatus Paceibacterota bacterium]
MGSNLKKESIMRLTTIFAAAIFAIFAAACGKTPEPAPAKPQGQAQAEKLEDERKAVEAKKRQEEELAAYKVEQKKKAEEQAKAEAEAGKTVTEKVTSILGRIEKVKSPSLAEIQEIGQLVSDSEYPGSAVSQTLRNVIGDDGRRAGYETVEAQERRLVSSVLLWAQKNPALAESVLNALVPVLRTKAGVVKSLKESAGLFKKPYKSADYVEILACSQEIPKSREEICEGQFKAFGLKYTKPADEKDQLSLDWNAQWTIQFLNRRALNGGDKFAQLFQRFFKKLTDQLA